MKIITAPDIFVLPNGRNEAMCVTTNGIIKSNGLAVMGKGIAKTVNDRFNVAGDLALHLKNNGNTPGYLGLQHWAGHEFCLLSFPTKNHWRDNSDIELIKRSCIALTEIADRYRLTAIYTVPPGCSNGHLDWEYVKSQISPLLDDRFIIVIQP